MKTNDKFALKHKFDCLGLGRPKHVARGEKCIDFCSNTNNCIEVKKILEEFGQMPISYCDPK